MHHAPCTMHHAFLQVEGLTSDGVVVGEAAEVQCLAVQGERVLAVGTAEGGRPKAHTRTLGVHHRALDEHFGQHGVHVGLLGGPEFDSARGGHKARAREGGERAGAGGGDGDGDGVGRGDGGGAIGARKEREAHVSRRRRRERRLEFSRCVDRGAIALCVLGEGEEERTHIQISSIDLVLPQKGRRARPV